MEFSICSGEGSGRVIFHMFSATHQNAFKAIKYFWSFKGKNENVLELHQNHFKDLKKVADFPYVRGGVN